MKTKRASKAVASSPFLMPTVRILEPGLAKDLIRQRQKLGIDGHDEVWEGVYVVPPLANNPHQGLIGSLTTILTLVIAFEGRGVVHGGANVSDRRRGWEKSFRVPDIVVVLNEGKAIDCETHWLGGPDFLVEVRSPGDETEKKIDFYSRIEVQELLIIDRDTRQLRLYRHDGVSLHLQVPVGDWLSSSVVPLTFRLKKDRGKPKTAVKRTDGQVGEWLI